MLRVCQPYTSSIYSQFTISESGIISVGDISGGSILLRWGFHICHFSSCQATKCGSITSTKAFVYALSSWKGHPIYSIICLSFLHNFLS